jgi:hypothetical protein
MSLDKVTTSTSLINNLIAYGSVYSLLYILQVKIIESYTPLGISTISTPLYKLPVISITVSKGENNADTESLLFHFPIMCLGADMSLFATETRTISLFLYKFASPIAKNLTLPSDT